MYMCCIYHMHVCTRCVIYQACVNQVGVCTTCVHVAGMCIYMVCHVPDMCMHKVCVFARYVFPYVPDAHNYVPGVGMYYVYICTRHVSAYQVCICVPDAWFARCVYKYQVHVYIRC